MPPNFYHQVSFSRRQFSLARLFFLARLVFEFWHGEIITEIIRRGRDRTLRHPDMGNH